MRPEAHAAVVVQLLGIEVAGSATATRGSSPSPAAVARRARRRTPRTRPAGLRPARRTRRGTPPSPCGPPCARPENVGGRSGSLTSLRVAGHDPHPWSAAGRDGRERAHVVLDDRIGAQLVKDLGEPLVDVACAVDERLPGGQDEARELLLRAGAEHRRGVADEVLPELARRLRGVGRGGTRRMSRSSKPLASSVPANDSSATNTTRWPRRRSTSPMPTQLLVGPNAPSGKNTMVRASWAMAAA